MSVALLVVAAVAQDEVFDPSDLLASPSCATCTGLNPIDTILVLPYFGCLNSSFIFECTGTELEGSSKECCQRATNAITCGDNAAGNGPSLACANCISSFLELIPCADREQEDAYNVSTTLVAATFLAAIVIWIWRAPARSKSKERKGCLQKWNLQLRALAIKNFLIKRRRANESMTELLLPLVILTPLVVVANAVAGGPTLVSLTDEEALFGITLRVNIYPENDFYANLLVAFPVYLMVAFAKPIASLSRAIVNEKETKIREGMLMMGVKNSAIVSSWMVAYLCYYLVLMILVTCVCKFGNLFPRANFLALFSFFMTFGASNIAFCYALSVFFQKAKIAAVLTVMIWFIFGFSYVATYNSRDYVQTANCLSAPACFCLGLTTLMRDAALGRGLQYEVANALVDRSMLIELPTCSAMMLLDAVLYCVLGWYLEHVLPQEHGITYPPTFLLRREYWQPDAVPVLTATARVEAVDPRKSRDSSIAYEAPPAALAQQEPTSKCVTLIGLGRNFQLSTGEVKVAVKDLSLSMYSGQITALLGHNGAGKTTTIGILTGLVPPTSGTATIMGKDIRSQMPAIRKSLGVCPQHDLLYLSLTVREHLSLYARIRGLDLDTTEYNPTTKQIEQSVVRAVCDLGLKPKLDTEAGNLSGGMKRKLSLAIALLGEPSVCFLDEPTSGMDPVSRRLTWKVIKDSRAGRVIVLTTHFLDEADLLADRIAIMREGHLLCSGSSLFLKNTFGPGYRLSLVKSTACRASDVRKLVESCRKHVSDTQVLSDIGTELTLQLPHAHAAAFPAMMKMLESAYVPRTVLEYGVSCTTLEEVFLLLLSSKSGRSTAEEQASSHASIRSECASCESGEDRLSNETSSSDAFRRQFKAMLMKRYHVAKRDKKGFCCLTVLPACFLVILAIVPSVNVNEQIEELFGNTDIRTTYASPDGGWLQSCNTSGVSGYEEDLTPVVPPGDEQLLPCPPPEWYDACYRSYFQGDRDQCCEWTDPESAYFMQGRTPEAFSLACPDGWPCYTAACGFVEWPTQERLAEISPPRSTVRPWDPNPVSCASEFSGCDHDFGCSYSECCDPSARAGAVYEGDPGASLFDFFEYCDGGRITTNQSYPCYTEACPRWSQRRNNVDINTLLASLILLLTFSFLSSYMVVFCVTERESHRNLKHQQVISGLNSAAYWLSLLCWDILLGFLPMIILATVVLTGYPLYNRSSPLLSSVVYMLQYAFAQTLLVYGASFFFDNHTKAQVFVMVQNLLTGVLPAILSYLMEVSGNRICIAKCEGRRGIDRWTVENLNKEVLVYVFSLFPGYALQRGVFQAGMTDTALGMPAAYSNMRRDPARKGQTGGHRCDRGGEWWWCVFSLGAYDDDPHHHAFLCAQGLLAVLALVALEYVTNSPWLKQRQETYRWRWRRWWRRCWKCRLECCRRDSDGAAEDDLEQPLLVTEEQAARTSPARASLSQSGSILGIAAQARASLFQAGSTLGIATGRESWMSSFREVDAAAGAEEDEDVAAERHRVESGGDRLKECTALLMVKLRKEYHSSTQKVKVALRKQSLGIDFGECFGYLGVNGAGKTTTMKMLTGAVAPTSGWATIHGFDVATQQQQARKLVGYCPQFDALVDKMTIQEHLELFANIKGLASGDIQQHVENMIVRMQLLSFRDKLAGTLSGGNKRKLSAAIAMIASPAILFLDEPSTGMDPFARRFMWDVIRGKFQDDNCTVILTTHNMEECEALCTRVGVMVSGELKCLGSIQHLKTRFGHGYTVELKLRRDEAPDLAAGTGVGVGAGVGANLNSDSCPGSGFGYGHAAAGGRLCWLVCQLSDKGIVRVTQASLRAACRCLVRADGGRAPQSVKSATKECWQRLQEQSASKPPARSFSLDDDSDPTASDTQDWQRQANSVRVDMLLSEASSEDADRPSVSRLWSTVGGQNECAPSSGWEISAELFAEWWLDQQTLDTWEAFLFSEASINRSVGFWELVECHGTNLSYTVTAVDSVPLRVRDIFQMMESAKSSVGLMHYSARQTSLEQVFTLLAGRGF